jgi:hypothetical protein
MKFGVRAATTATTYFALDKVLDHLHVDPAKRTVIDSVVGATVGLHQLGAVLKSPDAQMLGAKFAAKIVNNPAAVDAFRAVVNRAISQASSQFTHVYNPDIAVAHPTAPVQPLNYEPQSSRYLSRFRLQPLTPTQESTVAPLPGRKE